MTSVGANKEQCVFEQQPHVRVRRIDFGEIEWCRLALRRTADCQQHQQNSGSSAAETDRQNLS